MFHHGPDFTLIFNLNGLNTAQNLADAGAKAVDFRILHDQGRGQVDDPPERAHPKPAFDEAAAQAIEKGQRQIVKLDHADGAQDPHVEEES